MQRGARSLLWLHSLHLLYQTRPKSGGLGEALVFIEARGSSSRHKTFPLLMARTQRAGWVVAIGDSLCELADIRDIVWIARTELCGSSARSAGQRVAPAISISLFNEYTCRMMASL